MKERSKNNPNNLEISESYTEMYPLNDSVAKS